MKPVVLITSGDTAGIGPEICVRALRAARIRNRCRPVLLGDARAFAGYGWRQSLCAVIDTGGLAPLPKPGAPSACGGSASFKAVKLAVNLALNGHADAVVTAPICKESWALARVGYKDHTSFLREVTECQDAAMLFAAGKIRCALVTEHSPIKALPEQITARKIIARAKTFRAALASLGIKNPSLAVCALNPHAGDGGVLGGEETRVIAPAVAALRRGGMRVCGPLPSDAAWQAHAAGNYDGILCMYHDQALAPLKLAAKAPVVHWTFGLPFMRVSPAHGTAFDIAGKGRADSESMEAALLFAAERCKS